MYPYPLFFSLLGLVDFFQKDLIEKELVRFLINWRSGGSLDLKFVALIRGKCILGWRVVSLTFE